MPQAGGFKSPRSCMMSHLLSCSPKNARGLHLLPHAVSLAIPTSMAARRRRRCRPRSFSFSFRTSSLSRFPRACVLGRADARAIVIVIGRSYVATRPYQRNRHRDLRFSQVALSGSNLGRLTPRGQSYLLLAKIRQRNTQSSSRLIGSSYLAANAPPFFNRWS